MSKPVAGAGMAFFSVLVILGINTPFKVLLTSSMELALAAAPVVLILNDCELAEKCKVVATAIASTKRKNFVILKLIIIKK